MGWFSKKGSAIRKLQSMVYLADCGYKLRIDLEPFATAREWLWVNVGINHKGSYKLLEREGANPEDSLVNIIENVCLKIIEQVKRKNVGACIDSIGFPWQHQPKVEAVVMKALGPEKTKKARKAIKKVAAKRKKG